MLNESRKTGLLRLKHLREVNEATAEEMEALRPRFERLADPANAPRVVTGYQLFQTPAILAEQLADMFPSFGRTLEPSAGLGRLYNAVRKRSQCEIVLVEQSAECCRELYRMTEGDGNARLFHRDFMSLTVQDVGTFDNIIMNPPFAADRRHVRHAISLLNPQGKLVAIVGNGPRQQRDLRPLATEWVELPANSFRSEGTNVNAAVFVYQS